MNIVFIEFIETSEFGKIAHFIDEKGNHVYSKILTSNDTVYYQELSKDELDKIKDEIE